MSFLHQVLRFLTASLLYKAIVPGLHTDADYGIRCGRAVHLMFNGLSETSITIERLPVFYKCVPTSVAALCCPQGLLRTDCMEFHGVGDLFDMLPLRLADLMGGWWSPARQRDNRFFPAWVFGAPGAILRLPYSLVRPVPGVSLTHSPWSPNALLLCLS